MDEVLRLWREAANQGHMEARFCLGLAYDLGQGVCRDTTNAESWYRKATGHFGSHVNLGLLLKDKGDMIGAEAEYRAALKIDPKHANTHGSLAG
jgi:TPR repeat protein